MQIVDLPLHPIVGHSNPALAPDDEHVYVGRQISLVSAMI